jgi:hypothetical protein
MYIVIKKTGFVSCSIGTKYPLGATGTEQFSAEEKQRRRFRAVQGHAATLIFMIRNSSQFQILH